MPFRRTSNFWLVLGLLCSVTFAGPVFADAATERWDQIKDSGDPALITKFREDFPGSPHDLDALVILAALISKSDTGDAPVIGAVAFNAPLTGFGDSFNGQSIRELLETSPKFAPVEGLPEEFWKEKTCNDCHTWTQEALCTQATHYTKDENVNRLNVEHPLGRPFKEALRAWAEGGCL
ncbi:hypothetical protein [Litoreibacter albidus]|uniref:Cytochrome c domain-containing protein n=1 Tax=Litoreibacter albidus TaxID=670155 RepID=A0A1H3AVA6_9RHOB|nr:hypothetical protein [Litoreibacter albidus]SDX33311.1 hypothetical protein SAMN04488001_2935 [Litoreibacter albidus]